jgi:hypothetical protein
MKLIIATMIIAISGVIALGQAPTLQVVTSDPNLPSELFYGSVKVKPLRVRPGTNPPQFITIDDSDFFTQEQYVDFLNRMPDSSGFAFWLAQITNCGNSAGCIEVQRINVSASFFLSIEFQQTGYLVERAYKSAFGDAPNATSTFNGSHSVVAPFVRFSDFIPDLKQIGQGVIVLQPGWETVLENNKVAYFNSFVQRSTFTSKYPPASTTPTAFVDGLFATAQVTPSASERSTAINEFGGAGDISNVAARAKALRDVAENPSLASAEFNRAFVLMQYFGYLRRDPNGGQDTDYTGYDFWLTKLNQFNGNYINAEMVKAFLSSIEYSNRF